MRKYIKIGIIVVIIFVILFVLKSFTTKPTSAKIVEYIEKQGYTLNQDKTLYSKQISEYSELEYNYYVSKNIDSLYEINYFDNYNYKLIKEKKEYADLVTSSLTENFNYQDNSLTYTYRVTYEDANIIYKGNYNMETEEFVCEKEFVYGVDSDSLSKVICDKLEYDVLNFSLEAVTFIPNADFINYMKSQG